MLTNWLILDVSSAAIPNAADFIEPVSAPSNYRDPAKIEAYIAEKQQERLAGASLDLDLCRITGIGWIAAMNNSDWNADLIVTIQDEADERRYLSELALQLTLAPSILTYGGLRFDLPLLMRRARYLGLTFPTLNLDRYRSPHQDLMELLSDRDPQRRRSLSFYVRRLGWTDLVKPLSGAEEAQIFTHQRWTDLEASLRHDVTAIQRLAQWLELIP